jgi:hypothetical protein
MNTSWSAVLTTQRIVLGNKKFVSAPTYTRDISALLNKTVKLANQ